MERIARSWWVAAGRGIVAIAVGVVVIMLPHLTILTIALMLGTVGVYVFIDGLLAIVLGIGSLKYCARSFVRAGGPSGHGSRASA
ncbi:MAG: DUF308 domain-containing protein [Candidatus Eremiobacteraeota bacterium]|nr:DUF308 domain-containing protein [Candidatus Eremiobacteraeota bacterium]